MIRFPLIKAVVIFLGILTGGSAVMPQSGEAAVINVIPGEGRFAAAIASASAGDTLVLEAGIHSGPVVIDRSLTIEGTHQSIVDGGGEGRVIVVSAPNIIIRSVTVRNSGQRLDKMDAGIYIDKAGDNALIENNIIENNLFGVYVQGPEAAIVRNNIIHGLKNLRVNERGNGVQLWNTPGSAVIGNDIQFGRDGIFVTTSKKNVFSNNKFTNLRFGVHYMYTHDSEISGNYSEGNHIGYALMSSKKLIVRANTSIGDRDHGIMLNYTNQSIISDNTVDDGRGKCVFIYNSNKNRFASNRFKGCSIGIHFTAGSEMNIMTENSFIGNETQVKYVGTRWLEWSDQGRGNYWSDNPSFDLDGDGIADTAYRSNDLVDQVLWRAPTAKLLLTSPAVHLLRWAQSQFPGLHPGGVVDSKPLMKPVGYAGYE